MNKLEEYEKSRDEIKANLSAINKIIMEERAKAASKRKNVKLQEKYEAIRERERKLKAQNMLLMGILATHLKDECSKTLKESAEILGLAPSGLASKVTKTNHRLYYKQKNGEK